MTENERRDLAFKAKAELPMTARAFDLLEQQIMAAWPDLPTVEERETAYQRVRALRDVKQMLVAAAAHVDVAEHIDRLVEQGF